MKSRSSVRTMQPSFGLDHTGVPEVPEWRHDVTLYKTDGTGPHPEFRASQSHLHRLEVCRSDEQPFHTMTSADQPQYQSQAIPPDSVEPKTSQHHEPNISQPES